MEAHATTDTQAWTLQFCNLPPPAPLAARSHPCLVRAGLAHTVLQQLLPGSLPTERLSHLQRPPRDHRQWRCGDSPGRRSALPPGPGPAANGPKSGLRWIHSCESGRASWTWGSTLPHGRRLEKGPSWCKEKGAWGGEGQVGLRARATWGAGTPQWLRVTPLPSRGPGPLPPPLTFQGLPFPRVPGRGECWIGFVLETVWSRPQQRESLVGAHPPSPLPPRFLGLSGSACVHTRDLRRPSPDPSWTCSPRIVE